jgi:hypothetical protein
MEKKTIVIDADAKGAVRGLKQAQDGAKGLTTGTNAATMATGKLSTGFKMLGTAMKAAGIGLVITAFMTLKSMMTSNIEFARKIEVVWKQLTAVFAVVVDRVTDLINGTRSLTNVFKGAGQEALAEARAMRVLTLAIQGVRDAERELIVERAQANFIIAQSRLLAEDETKSKIERKEALLNAIKVEEEVAATETDLAQQRMKNKEAEIAMGRSSEEDMEELAQLEANVINLRTASLLKKKRVVTEVNTFDREIAAEEKSRLKSTSGAVKEKTKSYEELHKEMRKGIKTDKDVEGITKAITEAEASHKEILQKLIDDEKKYHKTQKATIRNSSSKKKAIEKEIQALQIQIENRESHTSRGSEFDDAAVQSANFKNEQLNRGDAKRIEKLKQDLATEEQNIKNGNANRIANAEEFNQQQETDLQTHLDKKKAAIEEYEKTITELRKQATDELDLFLGSAMDKEIASIQEEFDKRFAMVKGNAEDEIRLEEWKAEQIENIQNTHYNNVVAGLKANAAEVKSIEQQLYDEKTSRMENGFALASSITGSLEKLAKGDIKKQKKLALLGVAIDTAGGIASAVRAATQASTFTAAAAPIMLPLFITEMIALVLGGVAQASSILNKVPGGGGGGAPQVQSLQSGISVGGEGGVPGLPGDGLDMEIPPIQAFVVESDVTSSQALQNDLELQATL